MLRLRMPAGRLTKEKMAFIAGEVKKYGVDKIKFTTCQTVQLHNLGLEPVCRIMEDALKVGIVTVGGGGDFPRNTTCSPLSGIFEFIDFSFEIVGKGRKTFVHLGSIGLGTRDGRHGVFYFVVEIILGGILVVVFIEIIEFAAAVGIGEGNVAELYLIFEAADMLRVLLILDFHLSLQNLNMSVSVTFLFSSVQVT